MTRAMRMLGGNAKPFHLGLAGLLLAAVALAGCGQRLTPAPIEDRSSLFFGRGTAIPVARPATERPPISTAAPIFTTPGAVTVQAGDTLYGISRNNNVPLRAIINANDLVPPYTLQVGQRLVLPRQAYHQVAPGDTVASIARAYRVSTQELVRLNGIKSPYLIYVGQPVLLPTVTPAGADAPVAVASRPTDSASVGRAAGTASPEPQAAGASRPGEMLVTSVSPNAMGTQPPVSSTGRLSGSQSSVASRGAATTDGAPSGSSSAPAMRDDVPPERLASLQPPSSPLPEVPITAPPGAFIWPIQGEVISSYGPKPGGLFNDGINIAVPEGTPVRAAQDGEVAYAGNELRGYGNLLLLRHEDGWMTAYAHNKSLLVGRGAKVRRGQIIARSGSSGSAGAPQLHFEMRQGTRAVDPLRYLAGQGVSMR